MKEISTVSQRIQGAACYLGDLRMTQSLKTSKPERRLRRVPVPARASIVFTVGYAGKTLAAFVGLLRRAGVKRVVDVRALPLSRRRGFSKSPLRAALQRAGIDYVHLKSAGNPYRRRKKDIMACLALYGAYLDRNPGVLLDLEKAIRGKASCLLCLEEQASACHRSIIVDRLLSRAPSTRVCHI